MTSDEIRKYCSAFASRMGTMLYKEEIARTTAIGLITMLAEIAIAIRERP